MSLRLHQSETKLAEVGMSLLPTIKILNRKGKVSGIMVGKLLSSSILLFVVSAASGQFFYNYDSATDPPPSIEGYDPSQYRYNPPSATNQQFLRPVVQNVQAPRQMPRQVSSTSMTRRTQGRSIARRYEPVLEPVVEYEPEPQVMMENQPEPEPVQDQRTNYHEERRATRRRSRLRYNMEPATTSTPIVYGPSVFENIGLGQAPSGVYIPHDSLLNTLKNPAHRSQAIVPYSRPVQPQSRAARTEPIDSPQPGVNYFRNEASQYFVTPPSDIPSSFQNVVPYQQPQQYIAPIPNPRVATTTSVRRNRRINSSSQTADVQQTQQAQPVQSSRRQRQRIEQPQPEYQYGAESSFNNGVDDYDVAEDDIERARPPMRQPQRRNNQAVAPVQRQSSRSQPATQPPQTRQRPTFKPAMLAIAELPADTDEDGIPGAAGVNYPTLHVIPDTSFSCSEQPHNGYYADLETSCQVVHLCQAKGVKSSFLCPNGTIFSQEKFACQWWYEVNCADSPRYYGINDSLYKVPAPQSRTRN